MKAITEVTGAQDLLTSNELFHKLSFLAEKGKWGIENYLEEIEDLFDVLEINEGRLLYSVKKPLLSTPSLLIPVSDDLLRRLAENPNLLYQISPRKFEEIVAEIFYRNGFAVELTKSTRDGGKDIIAVYDKLNIRTKYIIECKRWSMQRKVSLGIVQRLLGVKISTASNKGILATTSTFTRDAINFTSNHIWDLELKDHRDIVKWLRSLPAGR